MGIFYETLLTDALNDQGFNYTDDMDEVELFLIDYFSQNELSIIEIKVIDMENKPRRLKINYYEPSSGGGSTMFITVNKFNN